MKCTILILFFVCLVSFATCDVSGTENHSLSRQKRQTEIFDNTRKLIEELTQNLRASAKQAVESLATFSTGIQGQLSVFRQRVQEDIAKLRERVAQTIKGITDRFQSSGTKVQECVETHRKDADALFNSTFVKTMGCAAERVEDISDMINDLTTMSKEALEGADGAIAEMKNCTQSDNGNFLSMGACLGAVVVRTEIKGASFLARSGLLIARINLALSTLPASLEVCAGVRLVETGVGTAKIAMEIGSCSASSIFSVLSGNNNNIGNIIPSLPSSILPSNIV